jgi:glycosyltransferase involved in cell wall biosynthesis
MPDQGMILYIGGFELPDRNAAAQRVIGIAKSLRDSGYKVRFINALKEYSGEPHNTEYFGFSTFEYKREGERDYLFGAQKAISIIKDEKPSVVIAYNYPAVALNRIRKYCQSNKIKCVADVTEWPKPVGGSLVYRIIKELDTAYRMRYVQKHVDSVIAISRYLYDYYREKVPTILIPPTVDIADDKWNVGSKKNSEVTSFAYAGSPSALKEKLDVIVRAIIECGKTERIVFNVVGITKDQFVQMYSWTGDLPKEIVFWGRMSHTDVIRIVKEASWSIILRDNNIVVKAGFPTKLVESISCGTPVITNRFSNVTDYLTENNSILINSKEGIEEAIKTACKYNPAVDREQFDYRRYASIIHEAVAG